MRPGMPELLRGHSCRIETHPRTDSPARPEANIRQAANTDFEREYLPEFPANVRKTQRIRKVRIRRQGPHWSPVSPSVAFAGRDGHRRLGAGPRYEVRKARLYAGESSPFSSSGRAGTSPAHERTIRKTRNPPRTGRGGRRGDSLRGRLSGLFSTLFLPAAHRFRRPSSGIALSVSVRCPAPVSRNARLPDGHNKTEARRRFSSACFGRFPSGLSFGGVPLFFLRSLKKSDDTLAEKNPRHRSDAG